MARTAETVQDELVRRHRATVTAILCVFALVLLLAALSFAHVLDLDISPNLVGTLRIVIAFLGVGAVVLRRTMFSAMRLRDIAALGGPSALLATLQKTTVRVTILAAAIAVMAFVISLATGDPADMVWFGLIAVAVLLYAYPRRAVWQTVLSASVETDAAEARPAKGTIA